MNNIDQMKAALGGFAMEHGRKPDFILTTSDVFQAISIEVAQQPMKYGGVVKVVGENIRIDGIEVGQITGTNRVELVVDPLQSKAAGLLIQ